ncbi:capsular biosynthesis protein [Sphingomonas panacis]|uniref:Capsular biosynthesis protein n=1 Tax=Sphingomonas panacis TaxID=1560345 RepID=A0A1B3ZAD5_9SPHN|nr:polysaccharide biosynthesis/export family protein [Sphingomonas panacis]AOH84393.1 capsular biosynthesis protein [Sphingomonas panacis]
MKISILGAVMLSSALTGCTSLGASGPTSKAIAHASDAANANIKIIDLTDATARKVVAAGQGRRLSDLVGSGRSFGSVIGPGDTLDVSIWEAPPAALFGTVSADPRLGSSLSTARTSSIPEQIVDDGGRISIPFAGSLNVLGRTAAQVEQDIIGRLRGKAHQPQAIVRIVRNASANVTVVGEVAGSTRMPLTSKGERLLDALASAGGVRQPVGKMTIQVTRGDVVTAMPMDQIIRDPAQNIRLQPNDVVTALFQPYSFTALGALANSSEINFEGTGLTLAQALGRIGGLRDDRANVRGIFIFRLEDPAAVLDPSEPAPRTTPDGKVPVIYRLDLSNPASFFVAQGFPIRNHDVIYVSNAPLSDVQKFINLISPVTFSILGLTNAVR